MDWSRYDKLLKEADRDDREGEHIALITGFQQETWPSGDARYKVELALQTARNATADITLSDPPSEAQMKDLETKGDRGTLQAVARNIRLQRELDTLHGLTIDGMKAKSPAGTKLGVKLVKTKAGFVRVIAVKRIEDVEANRSRAQQVETTAEDIPF